MAQASTKKYPRMTCIGFYVKTPPYQTNQKIADFICSTLTSTQQYWTFPGIKYIKFMPSPDKTPVMVSACQTYLRKWKFTTNLMFSDYSKALKEETVYELNLEESKEIIRLIKEKSKTDASSVYEFQRVLQESKEIRQPSPLPGIIWSSQLPSFTSSLLSTPSLLIPQPQVPDTPQKRPASPSEAAGSPKAKRVLAPRENPFTLKDNYIQELKGFLLSAKPWNEPTKYDGAPEDPAIYQNKKRAHENKPPAIAVAMTNLIPPIVRRTAYQGHIITATFTSYHNAALSKMFNQLHCKFCSGVYTHLQWPNMKLTTYNLNTANPAKPTLNFIEAHRRLISIEKDIATMTAYLEAVLVATNKTPRVIAPKSLSDAHAIIYASNPCSPALENTLSFTPSATLLEQAEWFKANRAAALTRFCPFLSELDWGTGLLGLLWSLRNSLIALDTEEEAQSVLTTLMAFIDRRTHVYLKDMQPILYYGYRLTQHTQTLQDLCEKFKGLSQVPFPTAGHFHEFDAKGRLLSPDGQVISMGLDLVPFGREDWLLPFAETAPPDPEVETICNALAAEEDFLVDRMLSDLELDRSAPLFLFKETGHNRIRAMLQADNFSLNLTSVLPPSAAMPEAWYEPEKVFA